MEFFSKKCGKICAIPTDYIILRPCLESQKGSARLHGQLACTNAVPRK